MTDRDKMISRRMHGSTADRSRHSHRILCLSVQFDLYQFDQNYSIIIQMIIIILTLFMRVFINTDFELI